MIRRFDAIPHRAGMGIDAVKRYLDQRLRFQSLRILDALEIHGSLLKASAALGVSQPALTKSIRDIEDIVGARLFDRHARGMRPTEIGIVMIRSCRKILAELRRTEEDLDHLTDAFGGVAAIGSLPVTSAGLLPIVMLKLRAAQPEIKIRVEEGRTEALLPLLAAGQIDLITGRFYEPPAPDGFEREELWQDPMALLARTGHPLLKIETITVDAIGRYELVLPSDPQRVAAEIDQIVELLGLADTPVTRSTSYGFLREVLLASDAIAIMPPMLMLGDLNRGTMAARALPVAIPTRSAGIITVKGRKLNPAAAAFVDCLRGHIGQIVEQGIGGLAAFAPAPARS